LRLLQTYCAKQPEINLVQSFNDPNLALSFLSKEAIDLILLDVEMPDISGIDLLNQLPIRPHVIFSTSHASYAFEAFEFEAIDYLKKPFNFPRFQKAIDKVIEKEISAKPVKERETSLYIKEKGKLIRIAMDEILYFENVRDYVCVKTTKHTYTIISTLKEIAKKLPDDIFLKVHRSYIVNLDKIVDIDNTSLVVSNKVIPISRVNRPILMDKIRAI
jgi:DNA-binding LytR/AlgR family response regulator